MYSYEDRIRAVELYVKLGKRVKATISQLGLFGDFVAERASIGAEPLGLAAKFAEKLQISASMWSQIKKGRVISDKLARQIENRCGKEPLWLDAPQSAEPLPRPGRRALCRAGPPGL